MMRPLVVLPFLVIHVAVAAGLELDGVTLFTAAEPMAAEVIAQVTCQAETDPQGTRRPFAGGFVFTARCPGNHANFIQALVFAPKEDGSGARLLTFPQPSGRGEPADSLSNIGWDAKRRELTELFVNPEERICRHEARWRLDGPVPEARLVFWRETRDCKGKRGWRVVIDRRRR